MAHPLPLQPGADLLSTIRGCRLCTDLPLGPNPILQWSADATILIAGQAPGRITHQKSRPFADPSGARLRQWLGVSERQFYDPAHFAILPMAFCFPGNGPNGDLPPPPVCAASWRHALLTQTASVRLTILLGRHAIAWHLPHKAREPLASLVRHSGTGESVTFVLPHPSPRNNRWLASHPWFAEDILPRLRNRVAAIIG